MLNEDAPAEPREGASELSGESGGELGSERSGETPASAVASTSKGEENDPRWHDRLRAAE